MSDHRSDSDRLWDNQQEDARHAAAASAAAAALVSGFSHNSLAVAAYYGIDTTRFDLEDDAFDDALDLQPKVAEMIEHCESLDPEARSDLARAIRAADLMAPDPGAAFVAVINRLRREAIRRHPSARELDEQLRTHQPMLAISLMVSLSLGLPRVVKDRLSALVERSDREGFAVALAEAALEADPALRRVDSELQWLISRADASRTR